MKNIKNNFEECGLLLSLMNREQRHHKFINIDMESPTFRRNVFSVKMRPLQDLDDLMVSKLTDGSFYRIQLIILKNEAGKAHALK